MIQINLFTKQKETHRLRELTYGYHGGRVAGGIDWEFEIDMYTLLYLKLKKNNNKYLKVHNQMSSLNQFNKISPKFTWTK